MKHPKNSIGDGHSVLGALLLGLLCSWLLTLVLTAIIAVMLDKQTIEETHLAPAAVISMLLATITGALVAAKRAGKARLIVSLVSGGIYFLSLLGCNLLFFGGAYQGVLPAMLCAVGGSVTVGLLEIRQKGQSLKHMKRLYKP